MKVQIKKISSLAIIPEYKSDYASGMDIYAAIEQDITILPAQRVLIPTGIAVSIPKGYEIQIRPRSGLALNNGISLVNTPGTIDADYRGEIKIIMINFSSEPFTVNSGMRIAQMVLLKVERIEWDTTDSIDDTKRGEGGFGHTGL